MVAFSVCAFQTCRAYIANVMYCSSFIIDYGGQVSIKSVDMHGHQAKIVWPTGSVVSASDKRHLWL